MQLLICTDIGSRPARASLVPSFMMLAAANIFRPLSFLLILTLFGHNVQAGLSAPNCTVAGWEWSFNTLQQNPCVVGAYLEATCTGSFSIPQLPSTTVAYLGPKGPEDASLCQCNTVVYSLLSACDACQGASWIPWSEWKLNCTQVVAATVFPNAIPSGTRVPHWAYLNVTVTDTWNAAQASQAGDLPEAVASPESTVSSAATETPVSSSSAKPSSTGHGSNTGAIAGGVVGGVVGLGLVLGVGGWLLMKRRGTHVRSHKVNSDMDQVYNRVTLHHTPEEEPPKKYYNPADPTTFPSAITPPGSSSGTFPHGFSDLQSPTGRNQYTGLPMV
ncbi:hypothetical protein BC834DRAFT_603554 [Gloeopeniophorella convolvens]|nr:hypothetical protein BC834DRAFT_603554 [Gloeopeniophorella convolvens]